MNTQPHTQSHTSATTTPLLSIQHVSKAYDSTVALDDVSIDIHPNEFFALLGPSGCGKTTLLRAIAGFEAPDTGSITINDDDGKHETNLLALPPNKRPVNLMFQSYALFPHMNVRKNIAYGLEREGMAKDEINVRVDEVLETVALTDKAKARPNQLSGGQRQRVALARAIVKRPKLLLLDEPLSALDRKVRAEMQLELKRLQHEVGITFVVVTHDQEEAMSMADRIAVMHDGRVQQVADPVTLYTRPANVFVADFIGSGTLIPGTASTASGTNEPTAFTAHVSGSPVLPAINPNNVIGESILMLRPEHVRVHTNTAEAALAGTVVETHFYGGSSVTAVQIAGLDTPLMARQPGAPAHRVGEAVALSWNADDAIILTDTSSTP
ncbi:MAG: ABC transporter ATP-binding protein [Actinomycetota bacterium]|nr:ABC transporter ATP-binding protein [Actinomycetota bacterium]